jgi:hypothetical protein
MDIVHSIVVQNSLSEVFNQLRTLVGHSNAGKGSKYSEAFSFLGKKRQFQFEITQILHNRGIQSKTTDDQFPIEKTFEVVPSEGGIKILWKVNIKPQGMSKMLAPFIKNDINRQLQAQMTQLKDTLDFKFMKATTLAFVAQNDKHWL